MPKVEHKSQKSSIPVNPFMTEEEAIPKAIKNGIQDSLLIELNNHSSQIITFLPSSKCVKGQHLKIQQRKWPSSES